MQFFHRILRYINSAPACQQRTVFAERFIELLFFVQWSLVGLVAQWWMSHTIRANQSKVCGQFFHCLPQGQLKKFCGEVDYITIRTTAETVKSGIHFHTGIAVCMEWAADHTAAIGLKSVVFGSLPGGDTLFYQLKKIVLVEDVPPLQFHTVTAFLRFCAVLFPLCDFRLPPLQFLQDRWTSLFFDFLQSGLFDLWC